jgi:hypothetical protein
MRRKYLPGVKPVDNALSVYQNLDRARERNEWEFFEKLGMQNFRHVCDSIEWTNQIQNRHIGRYVDDAAGIPVLVPAVSRNQIDIAIVHCDLSDPGGLAIFTNVLEIFEKIVPVVIVIPSDELDLSTTVTAMRMGAEGITTEDNFTAFEKVILDAPLIFRP